MIGLGVAVLALLASPSALALRPPRASARPNSQLFARRSTGTGGGAIPPAQGDNMQSWGTHYAVPPH